MLTRNLTQLKEREFDLLVVGGGVTGGAIAMDASLRGLTVALVEKDDFGSGTSAATSKLIHGGLRYLKQGQLTVVRESLVERRYMEIAAPHLVRPKPFLIPVYEDWGPGRWLLQAGFFLYDSLSFGRNRLPDPDQRMPRAKWIGRDRVLEIEPGLHPTGLKGGFYYYDCGSLHPERLTLDFALTAASHGAVVANHLRATGTLREGNQVQGVLVRDELGEFEKGKEFPVRAGRVVNAGGPWADEIIRDLDGHIEIPMQKALGIHLITPPVMKQDKVTLGMTSVHGRHFFLIPWRGYNLIGTTDRPYHGSMDDLAVLKNQAIEFIDEINATWAGLGLRFDQVIHSYIGARPLIGSGRDGSYKASRRHEIFNHEKLGGLRGLFTVLGGKYTTSRALAELAVDRVMRSLDRDRPFVKSKTRDLVMVSGTTGNLADFRESARRIHPDTDTDELDRLIDLYGVNYDRVLEVCARKASLGRLLRSEDRAVTLFVGEIHYAVEKESVRRLTDLLLYRTGAGTLGHPGQKFLEQVAAELGKLLGWNATRQKKEIQRYLRRIQMKS